MKIEHFLHSKIIIVYQEDLKLKHSDLLVHVLWSGSGQSDNAAMSGTFR